MSNYVTYPLSEHGAVRNWLGCGPLSSSIDTLEAVLGATGSPFGEQGRWTLNYWAWHEQVQAMKSRIYRHLDPPLELIDAEPLPTLSCDGSAWHYLSLEDDSADFSRFSFIPTLFSGHLYAEIDCDAPGPRQAELLTIGPAHVWLEGQPTYSYREPFGYVHPHTIPVTLDLKAEINHLWLRGDMIRLREARLALGLRFPDATGLRVRLPIGAFAPSQWRAAERGLNAISIPHYAFPNHEAVATLAAGGTDPFAFTVHAELPSFKSEAVSHIVKAGDTFPLPITEEVLEAVAKTPDEAGLHLVLRPAAAIPIEKRFEIFVGTVPYSRAPYGTYDFRRNEAVAHLARMSDVMGTVAAVRSGRDAKIASATVDTALRFLNERRDTADFYALSLLVLLYWYGDSPALCPSDHDKIRHAFQGFKCWLEEPGLDAMCYFTENHQILFHTSEYLASQYWPELTFVNSSLTGEEKLPSVKAKIEAWIERRLRGNFSEWDSNAYLAMDAFALLALVEFAEDTGIRERATNLLDKLFFMLAVQSYRGTHGCTHGRCYVTALLSGRAEATSGLQRLAWGMGTFNGETRATGLLAMSERYRVPELIQRIGAHLPEVLVSRVRSTGAFQPQADMRGDRWDIRTVTRRTQDYLLAAAVDYRPGEMGIQEHLWQATLGPEAVVFTTYPGNRLEHGNARPNFWAGAARLPHVAMHGRTVIWLYRLDMSVGLGFSHAYFPTASFDTWQLEDRWAFARYRDGYLGLWGDGRLELTREGRFARQELRSCGAGRVWMCTVGSTVEDGSFENFCERLKNTSSPVVSKPPGLRWQDLSGDELGLTWKGRLHINGIPLDSSTFPHYENRYTRTEQGDRSMILEHAGANTHSG